MTISGTPWFPLSEDRTAGAALKLTPDALDRVVAALQQGADMALAAQSVGCTRQAVYYHYKKNAEFRDKCDDARAVADDNVVSALYQAAIDGNTTAMIFWLKNRRPDEWRDRREHRIESNTDRDYVVVIPGLDEADPDSATFVPNTGAGVGEPN